MVVSTHAARRRRRRTLTLGLIATAAVLLVNLAGSYQESGPKKRLALNSYVDAVAPLIERSSQQGGDLSDLRERAGTLGAAALTRRLDQIVKDTGSSLRQLEEEDPPRSLARAHTFLLAAFTARAQAASQMREALSEAIDTRSRTDSARQLEGAGQAMITSDRVYELFVSTLPTKEVQALPKSRWVQDDQSWSEPEMLAFVTSLRSAKSLSAVHDLSVVYVATDPEPVGSEASADGRTLILPTAKALKARIVVANVGNKAEKKATVAVVLRSAGGGEDTAREFVDLGPGQRRAFTFSGLRATPGEAAQLIVSIDVVQGESNTADNTRTLDLAFR